MILLSILFFSLAAVCNALMDNITHHWYKSIFNNLDIRFWNPQYSWSSTKFIPFTKYKLDAWHLAKSLMIVFVALSATFAWRSEPCFIDSVWSYVIYFLFLGLVWNGTFNLFYNHLFNRKE